MAILGGVGIAVPTDKELPDNELENIVKAFRCGSDYLFSEKERSD